MEKKYREKDVAEKHKCNQVDIDNWETDIMYSVEMKHGALLRTGIKKSMKNLEWQRWKSTIKARSTLGNCRAQTFFLITSSLLFEASTGTLRSNIYLHNLCTLFFKEN